MRRFGAPVLIAAVVIAAPALAALTPTDVAVAAADCQAATRVVGDVDGDGKSDLLVGVPAWSSNTGEVDLRLTTAPSEILTLTTSGLGIDKQGNAFGAAVVLADLNDDGCSDIIVGAPGANSGAGQVHIVLGAEDGFEATGGQTLNSGATSGDRFGSSLAIAPNQAGTGFDLWVGAPLDNVDSATDAGSVVHYVIKNINGDLDVDSVETITQNSPGVPGSAERSDHFGDELSATVRGVLVGDQHEDVGNATDAGSITLLSNIDIDPGFDQALGWSQASRGVPGNAETGDHFGAAVSAFGEHIAAGVPDEDVNGSANAGMVQLFSWSSATPVPTGEVKQYIPGVPGKVEAGDRFGAAAVHGRNMGGCSDGSTQIAIGAPGEDIKINGLSMVDAGTAVIFTPPPGSSCIHGVDQGNPLSDGPEKGDRFGITLALGRHGDDSASDRAYIGVPGEDGGAGMVQSTPVGSGANSAGIIVGGSFKSSVGYSGGAQASMSYGTVIASPAGE
jgi:hypothetical protein